MCLAIPMKIESMDGDFAVVNIGQTKRNISISLLEEATVGDYVLVHAGFAIKTIDEEQAMETIELLNKMVELS